MTPRIVMSLGIVAIISAGAAGAVWRAENVVPSQGEAGEWLLPGLAENVNALAAVEVRTGDKVIELKRNDAGWTVQPSGYEVKPGNLQKVLVGLVRMTKLEPRTASADKYRIIQVEEAGKGDSQSRHVTLKDEAGRVIGDVILGKAATGYTSGAEQAQYVRLAGDQQSWLVRGSVSAGGDIGDWVDTTVMQINQNTVKQAVFTHPDGEVLTITKTGKDDNGNNKFEIAGLPEGVKPKDDLTVRYGATDIANVEFTDVRKAAPGEGETGKVLLETDDGMIVSYRLKQDRGQTWLQAKVIAKGKNEAEAEKVSKRIDGWEFALADYKIKQFTKRLSDFLDMQQ